MRLLFGPGQRHDATRSHELIAGLNPRAVIADKGYDADHLHQAIRDAGAEPVIPAKSNRRERRPHNKALYKERNLIERFFNKLKQFLRRLRPARSHCDPAPVKSSLRPKSPGTRALSMRCSSRRSACAPLAFSR